MTKGRALQGQPFPRGRAMHTTQLIDSRSDLDLPAMPGLEQVSPIYRVAGIGTRTAHLPGAEYAAATPVVTLSEEKGCRSGTAMPVLPGLPVAMPVLSSLQSVIDQS